MGACQGAHLQSQSAQTITSPVHESYQPSLLVPMEAQTGRQFPSLQSTAQDTGVSPPSMSHTPSPQAAESQTALQSPQRRSHNPDFRPHRQG